MKKGALILNQRDSQRSSEPYTARRLGETGSAASRSRAAAPVASAKAKGGPAGSTSQMVASQPAMKAPAAVKPGPTQEQIAIRARQIWQASGCKPGRDKENWLQAEAQLRAETRTS
jgi:hypothetical protein